MKPVGKSIAVNFDHIRGYSSGYVFWPLMEGGYGWRAWCAGNTKSGTVAVEEQARQLAQIACDELEKDADRTREELGE